MDIGTAFGKPFSNIKNLVIGIILSVIPILNIITIPGYFLRIAKKTMGNDNSLPGFDSFGELIVDSIKLIVVGIVYAIIIGIVSFILALIPYAGVALIFIWQIVMMFVVLSAVMTLAKTGSIGSALGIPSVAKRAANGGFIISVIVGAIILGIIASIVLVVMGLIVGASMLPLILGGTTDPMALAAPITAMLGGFLIGGIVFVIVGYILEVFFFTLVAESYQKAYVITGPKAKQVP